MMKKFTIFRTCCFVIVLICVCTHTVEAYQETVIFSSDGQIYSGDIESVNVKNNDSSIGKEISLTSGRINVKDFGAKGDGKVDDTRAIVSAIASASGGLVEFPHGRYRITKTIDIVLKEYGPLSLTGLGGTASIIMEGAGPAFRFSGSHTGSASPLSVKDITWDKERMPMVEALEIVGNNPDANGLEFQYCHMPVVKAVLIRDVKHGIHLTSRNRNVIISNCHIYNCKGIGVYLDSVNLHQIIINDCHISYCREGGIKVSRSEIRNFQITGNDIEYNYDAQGEGVADVWVDCSQMGSVREGTISGNTIQAIPSPGGANIRFTGPAGDNKKIGLWSITGNHISNHTMNFHLENVHGISITGNTILRAYDRHMMIENSRNLVISGNVFDYNSDYFPQNISAPGGVTISGCDNIILSENIIDGVEYGSKEKGGAINLINSSMITVRDCHISNSRFRGIDIENSVNIRVSECVIYADKNKQEMLSGLELRGNCSGTVIRNNFFSLVKAKAVINNASGASIQENSTNMY